MRKVVLSIVVCAGAIFSSVVFPARAAAQSNDVLGHLGLFANAKEVFRPLLADPQELQLAVRLTTPVSKTNLGDIAVGDYFGLYRWALPWKDSYVQWSMGAGVFARFDLVAVEKTSEVVDYSVRMPIDVRLGTWTTRLMPYHTSSHLGDDFIKKTGILPDKYSFDSFKWLFADDLFPCLRLYAGYNYVIRNRQSNLGRNALQAGTEWTSGWWARGHAQIFWANDFQSWQRVGWNPAITTQLGIRLAHDPQDRQTLSLFTEYGAGHLSYGQLFQTRESHWVLGLRFDLP